MAAFQVLNHDPEERTLLEPVLDEDRREMIATMVDSALSSVMLEILPYIEDCDLDALPLAMSGEEALVMLDLRVSEMLEPKACQLIGRRLEQAVSLEALALLTAGSRGDAAIADTLATLARNAVSALRDVLGTPLRPFLRRF